VVAATHQQTNRKTTTKEEGLFFKETVVLRQWGRKNTKLWINQPS